MRIIKAIFIKQLLSYIKNPERWGAPATFLLIPFLFLVLVPGADMAILTAQFIIMFVGISMVGGSAGFIREDQATMNLRFMGMAGVKPYQYLIATSAVLLLVSLGILFLFGLISGHSGQVMINFLILSMIGSATSMLFGITLGLSKLAPFTLIFGILLGVGPVLATDAGSEIMAQIFYFTFTSQVNIALREDLSVLPMGAIQVVLANMAVMLILFVVMNARVGLDGEKLAKRGTARS